MDSISKLRGLVIGVGSIGERHLHNLRKIGIKEIGIYDNDKNRLKHVADKYNTTKIFDLNSAFEFKPNFSLVCTYPSSHINFANLCLQMNSHVFIEKPISSDITGVSRMLEYAKSKKLFVGVGYNMRFDKGLNILKNKLQNSKLKPLCIFGQWGHNIRFWHPGKDYRKHYVLKRGNGIILDDSHEYDYLRWLLNDEVVSVYCQTKKITSVRTETESIATMNLKFKTGIIASLLIDYVRPVYERNCHIIGENGDIRWSYEIISSKSKFSKKANSRLIYRKLSKIPPIVTNNLVSINDMYVREMKNFLESIMKSKEPEVNGFDALKTLKIGLAAIRSASSDKVIKIA